MKNEERHEAINRLVEVRKNEFYPQNNGSGSTGRWITVLKSMEFKKVF